MNRVIEEVERRIKRLEAEIEIAEEMLRRYEELGVRAKPVKVRTYSNYYAVMLLGWLAVGIIVLVYIQRRLPAGTGVPLKLYFLVLLLFAVPIIYQHLSKREESAPTEDYAERERMARIVLNSFYLPLKKALEENDAESIRNLASKLLEDPLLARGVEVLREGDPKVMAYALLLYANYSPELEEEVRETISRLHNRPLKLMLMNLIGERVGGEGGEV
ncbi:hypothetical protein [Thermococcus sp.]|uniref:hypothetical protein n=1 Tax=Thermococcus sp. TaxID=35749 RepID=UPI0026335F9A|nr:hypothetical protein [Thermococcus sp.]